MSQEVFNLDDVTLMHQTSSAYLFRLPLFEDEDDDGELDVNMFWIPQSQVIEGEIEGFRGEICSIEIPMWLAKKSGIAERVEEYDNA